MRCGQSSSVKNEEEKIAGVSKKYDEGQTRSISGDEERLKGKTKITSTFLGPKEKKFDKANLHKK